MSYDAVASDDQITNTKESLEANGLTVVVADDAASAQKAVLELLPKGAEVLTSTSQTLETLGLTKLINESGEYDALRPKLNAMWGDPSKKNEQRKLGAAPDYIVGSVHAVTEEGEVLVASATGSQLPGYAYGAGQVIWVVGAQKIVKNIDQAIERLKTHVFPLENERAKKAYGSGSGINKTLVINREVTPDRITIVIVKEKLGF